MSQVLTVLMLLMACASVVVSQIMPQTVDIARRYGSFATYKNVFIKQYSSPFEDQYRQAIYRLNLFKIEMINNDRTNTYKAGINAHSDLTQEEFAAIYLNIRPTPTSTTTHNLTDIDQYKFQAKVVIDWVQKNKSPFPKDQGHCGASWAYAAVGVVECAFISRSFPDPNLSEQQLIDCALTTGSGCEEKGSIILGLEYIQTKGVTYEDLYPETYSNQKQACRTEVKGIFKIAQYNVLSGCYPLILALSISPVAVMVDATNWANYMNGVMNKCGLTPNYAAVLIGATQEYWRVKASWSETWGEMGTIRVAAGNTCGICSYAIQVVL